MNTCHILPIQMDTRRFVCPHNLDACYPHSALSSRFDGICSITWETFSPLGNKQRVWHLPWQPVSPRGLWLVALLQDTMGKLRNQSWPVVRALRGPMAQSASEPSQSWRLGESKAVSQQARDSGRLQQNGIGTSALGQVSPGLRRAHASHLGLFSLLGRCDYES